MLIDLSQDNAIVLQAVSDYVDKYIFNSGIWDELEDKQKLKAIYNSHKILSEFIPESFNKDEVDLGDIVTEIIWIIAFDDSTIRASQGATLVALSDMSIQFNSNKAASLVSPELIGKYGLSSSGVRRRVGRYYVPQEDTARTGLYKGDKERFRYGW